MDIKVFVTHYSKLEDRKQHITEQLKKHIMYKYSVSRKLKKPL